MLLEQSKEIQAKDKDVEELRKKANEYTSGESRPLLSAAQSKQELLQAPRLSPNSSRQELLPRTLAKDSSITRLSNISNVPSQGPEATHVESLRNVIREKDRESYTFLSIIENLRRENKKIKTKQTVKSDVVQLDQL
jgi:hypothetical protein